MFRITKKKVAVVLAAVGLAALAATLVSQQADASPDHAAAKVYAVQQVNPTTYISPLAKTLTKAPLEGAWIIRTRSCGSVCYELTSKGLGLSFQTEGTGFSTFNRTSGNHGFIYTTAGGGYCVHGTDTDSVIASNSACGASNTASQWVSDSAGHLLNASYGGYMGQSFLGNNATVRIEPESGYYYDEAQNS